MTFEIKLSQIKSAADFGADVAAYIKAKKDHQKTIGEPAPTAPPMVEAAVRTVPGSIDPPRADDYVADYHIEDDTPPPPSLDERKAALAAAAGAEADAEINMISPPLLRRLIGMSVQDAYAVKEGSRTQAQEAAIAGNEDLQKRVRAVHFHLATVEAEIHGLTAETIDAWKAPPFGG
jgi:hypothetical protein